MMTITIDSKWCKGCALCVRACPKNVLTIGQERSSGGYLMPYAKDIDACIGCKSCERTCPDVCISVSKA